MGFGGCCTKQVSYAAPLGNGTIVPVPGLEGVYVVEGIFIISGFLKFSRTMTIFVGPEQSLTLVNAVRLKEKGEAQLLELGEVKHVLRISGGHGMDDPYYVQTFGAELWGLPGMKWDEYCPNGTTLEMDGDLSNSNPFPGEAEVVMIEGSTLPECLLFFRDKGLLMTCDFIQQIDGPSDEKISNIKYGWFSNWVGHRIGFKGQAVTPPLYAKRFTEGKSYSSIKTTAEKVQALPYTTIISGHGPPIIKDAKEKRQEFMDSIKW